MYSVTVWLHVFRAKAEQLSRALGLGGTCSHCMQLSLINPMLPALWVPCHDLIFLLIFSF